MWCVNLMAKSTSIACMPIGVQPMGECMCVALARKEVTNCQQQLSQTQSWRYLMELVYMLAMK
jgi:hypothetical protein